MTEYLSAIIDRNIFFGNPEISGGQISPNGEFISFIKPLNGTMNIWVKKKDESFETAYPVTNDQNRPIRAYFWSRDSKYLLYAQDKGGNENFHIYAVNPTEDARSQGQKGTRDLTPFEDITAFILHLPKSDEDLIFVGINDRDKSWHDYYKLRISTGERSLILKNEHNFTAAYFDRDEELRLLSRSTSEGGTEILQRTTTGFESLLEANFEESLVPLKFKSNDQIFFLSNIGEVDLQGLYLFDLKTREISFIESDPEKEVDIESVSFSELTQEILATSYISEKKRIYWKNKSFEEDYNYLKKQYGNSEIDIISVTKDESEWLIVVRSDIDPGSVYHFFRKTKSIKFLYAPRPELAQAHLCKMIPVKYPSLDGLIIPAYITIPDVKSSQGLPAVVLPHGGPWARDYWGYNSFAQFLANRGYVVLQANFRGSTGYGKKFLNAAINEWGEKMQDDLTAGANYLVNHFNVDKNKIAIMGGSYGGYATLAGLTFTPDIYTAGVSIVGPSNLFTLLETIPPYWESARVMFHKRMGNPTTEEGRAQLTRQSPLFHVKNIKVPLMVAQGANDPRVKKSESDQIVIAMNNLGLEVSYLNFPDEGHGFANPLNNIAFIAAMEKFLHQQIGGRYQSEISNKIQEIISNVTVDVATLKMPAIVDDRIRSLENPAVHFSGDGFCYCYNIEIVLQGQSSNFEILRDLNIRENELHIVDSSDSPMGQMKDISILTFDLQLKNREIIHETIQLILSAEKDIIKSEIIMNGKEQNREIDAGQGFVSDGATLDLYMQLLIQKAKIPKTIRILDAQNQSVVHYGIELLPEESIQEQNCKKISIHSLEGPEKKLTYWFTRGTNPIMIQKDSLVPEMGGAIFRWKFLYLKDVIR